MVGWKGDAGGRVRLYSLLVGGERVDARRWDGIR